MGSTAPEPRGAVEAVVLTANFPIPVTSGGRKRTLRLIEAMQRAGVRPRVLTISDDVPEGLEEGRERGWAVEQFARPGASARGRLALHLRREVAPGLARLSSRLGALSERAAFVQLEEIGSAQFVRAVAPSSRCLVSFHNVDSSVERALAAAHPRLSRQGLRRRYVASRVAATEARAARRADLVVCVSEHDRDHFRGLSAADPMVVPNGVDEDLFALPAEPPGSDNVLFFGQFAWEPNAEGLLRFVREGWPRVVSERPSARLRIAGPGSAEKLAGMVAQAEGIQILGFVPDLAAELEGARAVVAPLWVGGGTRIKVLEALAAARPVAGTPIGVEGIGFEHDRHGLIASTAPELGEAVLAVLADDERARRYARAGRRLVEPLRWSQVTKPLEETYSRWLASATSHRD